MCSTFLRQDEEGILRAEAEAHGQLWHPDDDPHLAVLTVPGWLQTLINAALANDSQGTGPVRTLAAGRGSRLVH